jgi:hypothetical protein
MAQFRRLLLSYTDFKHAKLVAEYILRNQLHKQYPGEAHILLPALNCSMIIAYSRPFSGNSGRGPEAAPDLPSRFLKILSADELEIHRIALIDRNKFLAHTDAEATALEPVRVKYSESIELLVPLVADRMAPLDEGPTELLHSAASKLFEATLLERQELEPVFKEYFRVTGPLSLYAGPGDDIEDLNA